MSNTSGSASGFIQPTESRSSRSVWLQRMLEDTAGAWNLSRGWIWCLFALPPAIASSGIVAALAGKRVYKWYTEEDGVAEYAQAALYAAGCVLCFLIVRHHIRARNQMIAILYILLTAGLVFMVGEELSWGQRVFGWGTPPALQSFNKQDETNLHNIYGVGSTFKWIQGLVGAYGAFLPFVFYNRQRFPRLRGLIEAVVPHYSLAVFFLPMFIWRLYRNLWDDPVRYYYVITNYNEVIELILAVGFFLFLLFQWRRCQRDGAALAPQP